jgi:predicted transcriptional regulator
MPTRINVLFTIESRMFPPIASIRKRRVMLGKTQAQFASLCGVSQSMIAKVERGMVDPSYGTAARIFETLERLEKKVAEQVTPELVAKDLMVSDVVSVRPSDAVEKAAEIMLEKNFSQMPVIGAKGNIVGSVTERLLVSYEDVAGKKISEIMSELFPMVAPNTKISTVRNLLLDEPAVLVVSHKGKAIGIITKYDLIRKASDVLKRLDDLGFITIERLPTS